MKAENVDKYKSVLERIIENPFRMLLLPASAVEAEIDDAKDDVLFQFGFGIPEGELPFELAGFEISDRNESEVNRTVQALATEEAANYRMFWFLKENVPMTWSEAAHVEALKGEPSAENYDDFLAAYMRCMLCEDVRAEEWFLVLDYLEALKKNGLLEEVARLRGIEPTEVFLQAIYEELCAIYQAYFVERENHDIAAAVFAVQENTIEGFRVKMRDAWGRYYRKILDDWKPRFDEIFDSIRRERENSPEYKNVKADLMKYFPWALNDVVKLGNLYPSESGTSVFEKEQKEFEERYGAYLFNTDICYEVDVVEQLKQLNSSTKYYHLYRYYMKRNDFEEYMDALEKGTEVRDKSCMDFYVGKMLELGNFEKAWQIVELLEQQDGVKANALYARICEAKRDWKGAVKYYKVVVDVYGTANYAHNLVRACLKIDEREDAVKYAIYTLAKYKFGFACEDAAVALYESNLWHKAAYAYMQVIRLEEVKYSAQSMMELSWVRNAVEGLKKLGIAYSYEERRFSAMTERGLRILRDAMLYDAEDDIEDIDKRIEAIEYAAENGAHGAWLKLYRLYLRKIACTYSEEFLSEDLKCAELAKYCLAKVVEVGDRRLDKEEIETGQKVINILLEAECKEKGADGKFLYACTWRDLADWYYCHLMTMLPESEIDKKVVCKKALRLYQIHAHEANYKMSDLRWELAACCEVLNDYEPLITVMSRCDVRRADILGMAHFKSGNYKEAIAWLHEVNNAEDFSAPLKAKYYIFTGKAFEEIGDKETARKAYNYAADTVDDTYYKIKYYAIAEIYRLFWNEENFGGVLRETFNRITELRRLKRKPIAYARLMQVAADIMRAQNQVTVANMYQECADEYMRDFDMPMDQVWYKDEDRPYLADPQADGMSTDALIETVERLLANENWKLVMDDLVAKYSDAIIGSGAMMRKLLRAALNRADASDAQRRYIDNVLAPKLES